MSEITPEQATEYKYDLEEARAILEHNQKVHLELCQAEITPLVEQINAIAKKHGCLFTAQPGFTPDGRIGANIVVINAA